MMRSPIRMALAALVSGTLAAGHHAVSAQTLTAGITGTVRDESQAVLPGVTVEAASPSLIEKVRTTVTDGEGRYNSSTWCPAPIRLRSLSPASGRS